jgi:hypothetical protein
MNIFRDMDEEVQQTIKWFASELNYLKEFRESLNIIESREAQSEKNYAKIRKTVSYIENCQARAIQSGQQQFQAFNKIVIAYPALINFERQIEMSLEQLLSAFTLLDDDFKKKLVFLSLQLKLGPEKESQNTKEVDSIITKLEGDVDTLITWVSNLELNLQLLRNKVEHQDIDSVIRTIALKKYEDYRSGKYTSIVTRFEDSKFIKQRLEKGFTDKRSWLHTSYPFEMVNVSWNIGDGLEKPMARYVHIIELARKLTERAHNAAQYLPSDVEKMEQLINKILAGDFTYIESLNLQAFTQDMKLIQAPPNERTSMPEKSDIYFLGEDVRYLRKFLTEKNLSINNRVLCELLLFSIPFKSIFTHRLVTEESMIKNMIRMYNDFGQLDTSERIDPLTERFRLMYSKIDSYHKILHALSFRLVKILTSDNQAYIEYLAKFLSTYSTDWSHAHDFVYIADPKFAKNESRGYGVRNEVTIIGSFEDTIIALTLVDATDFKLRFLLNQCLPFFRKNPLKSVPFLNFNNELLWPK